MCPSANPNLPTAQGVFFFRLFHMLEKRPLLFNKTAISGTDVEGTKRTCVHDALEHVPCTSVHEAASEFRGNSETSGEQSACTWGVNTLQFSDPLLERHVLCLFHLLV